MFGDLSLCVLFLLLLNLLLPLLGVSQEPPYDRHLRQGGSHHIELPTKVDGCRGSPRQWEGMPMVGLEYVAGGILRTKREGPTFMVELVWGKTNTKPNIRNKDASKVGPVATVVAKTICSGTPTQHTGSVLGANVQPSISFSAI